MPQFQFDAYTPDGKSTHGSLFASSTADAVDLISKRGWIPTRVVPPSKGLFSWQKVSLTHQVNWYSTLADLLASGMPIAGSLDLLTERTTHSALADATRDLRNRVLQGESLSQAMKQHPKIFDSLAHYLVAAGEEGNFLDTTLERISQIKESRSRLISKLSSAFAYPSFLLLVGSLVLSGMMLFFVPKFEPLFERMRESNGLPWATEFLFGLNHFLAANAWVISIAAVIVCILVIRWLFSPESRAIRDRFMIQNRLVGPLTSGITIARFCQVLGSLLASGVRIQEATIIAGQTSGNHFIESAAIRAVENLTSGASLADAIDNQKVFPRDIVEMIRMGESTNRLEKVLQKMSVRLETRNEQRLEIALRMLEPTLMVAMAVLIGFVMIALLMPIFNASGQSFQ